MHRRSYSPVGTPRHVLVAAAALLLLGSTTAQSRSAEFEKRRIAVLAEAGQRHLRLGSWARDQGLVPQATAQFLRAVEVSEGNNPGARTVLGIMRSLGDEFWTEEKKRPSKALLREFDKRAAANETRSRKDHLELASRASAAKLDADSRRHFRSVLELGGELEFDDKRGWRIDGKRIADELADWLRGESQATSDGRVVFEAAGSTAPRLAGLSVHEDELLQVRTDLPGDAAARLHALGSALLPLLRERLDGAPTRRLVLTVFARRVEYVAYLTARGMPDSAAGAGLADYGTFQSLVSSQQEDGEPWPEASLHALVLHELAHLYFFAVAPAVMPDWYAEGFAESFGGQGTFTWDGKVLTLGGTMPADRLAALRAEVFPLRQLVDVRAGALLARDREQGRRYYTQCWALQHYLRQAGGPWTARFAFFEAKCRGQVLGAPQGEQRMPNPVPASVEFTRLFGPDLDQLDAAFREWLATL